MSKLANSKIKIYNRERSIIEEELIYSKELKEKLYGTFLGRIAINLIFKRKLFNKLYGMFQRGQKSRHRINNLIKKYQINIEEIEQPISSYLTLNDFFIRKLKPTARPINKDAKSLISTADSRLLVGCIENEIQLMVKGKNYYYFELINNKELIRNYYNGLCLIFRLVPSDYHRFCYIDNGNQGPIITIKGDYHASAPQPLINKYFPLYHLNYREYCILYTEQFGEVIQIEVGAMTVGKIIQNKRYGGYFQKGEEKGYFEYGGSTIILLFKPNTIIIDEDIQFYSQKGIETLVKVGSHIGKSFNKY